MFSIRIGFGEIENEKRKRNKGNSLLDFINDFTIIDLETTGLDPMYDHIIEVGAIKYRDGNEVDRISYLIKPNDLIDDDEDYDEDYDEDDDCYLIPKFIEELTGITNDMLKDAPLFNEVKNEIWDFLDGETLIGHNVNFDINFLYDAFISDGMILSNDFIDTMRVSRHILPELNHHRLTDLCNYYNIDSNYHRAIDDCIATFQVYSELKNDAIRKGIDLHEVTKKKNYSVDLTKIIGDPSSFDIYHPLYDKYCVFTGKLEKFTRTEAAQIVANLGGHCQNNVTKKTNFIILGQYGQSSGIKGDKSSKMKKAESLILQGQDLNILSENVFYDMIIDSEND